MWAFKLRFLSITSTSYKIISVSRYFNHS